MLLIVIGDMSKVGTGIGLPKILSRLELSFLTEGSTAVMEVINLFKPKRNSL